MAGSPSDDCGAGGSSNGISSGQRCQSGEALTEWRSIEQVENGTPSTSPPYWDTDEDDNESGKKPSELFGKFTWRIENFSQVNKRELRSNAFEVGGYKWYILIYPQGCDVHNHLSLFLCVANHDKLLPGWGHFAQFTIAVVNKDPKKSKYSDTLHRFWKKEHDWGWKKFMELSKVLDGFVVNDTLVIKAQVQVIREKKSRPFRCLDCSYRRELVRVYLTNVEQNCRRSIEERRGKLGKLIEDKVRWSSFCDFWLEVDEKARNHMSREKTEVILKEVVKHFFVEKEVTSTLVMDSLYSGLKMLESQSISKKGRAKLLDTEETPDPMVRIDKDMFVLADDVLLLLERAALEPLPPKDEKGPQNRTKDGNSGEDFNKDAIERDERRLTELGRRSVEIFVLAYIFSKKIEVAHQEAVAYKKQEELIREEEAAWQAEIEQKARRGAAEKEKRAKKKQSKQKRSSRKTKDKGRDERFDLEVQDKIQNEGSVESEVVDDLSVKQVLNMLEKPEALDDVSDVSFTGDDIIETLRPDIEDRDASPLNSDTDTSEVQPATEASSSGVYGLPVQNGRSGKKTKSVMDDSSSTCSTDSVPSVAMSSSYKGNSLPSYKTQISSSRGKKQHVQVRCDQTGSAPDLDNRLSEPVADVGRLRDASGTCRATEPESEADFFSMDDQLQQLEHHMEKVEEILTPKKKLIVNDHVNDKLSVKQITDASPSPSSPTRNLPSVEQPSIVQPKSMEQSAGTLKPFTAEKISKSRQETEKRVPLNVPPQQVPLISKPDAGRSTTPSNPIYTPRDNSTAHQVSMMSRPSSTPLISAPRPSAPVASTVQTVPLLSRSVSATGRLGVDSSVATHSYAPSYRNAIMGKTLGANPSAYSPHPSSSSTRPQWLEYSQNDANMFHHPSEFNGIQNLDIFGSNSSGSCTYFAEELPASVSSSAPTRQVQGVVPDEFPHLDIINYLLDEEHSIGMGSKATSAMSFDNGYDHPCHQPFNRQFSFPGEIAMSADASPSNYCRFDQLDNYHENGRHPPYGSFGNYNGIRNMVPLVGQSAYGNGHIDEVIHNQWPYGGGADISFLSIRNSESDRYSFQQPEYSNLANGVNGYTAAFRPSNGHGH
ncbi:hypothetical protein AQUCO_01700669v1 [Aquilegia coerulea]|uniref:MATH domain-containing protein n=1 Tax=Aquilegia coerulea TaxID=218851 RepID=A0A2G5DPW7_AQUCA|nr:hypothetical protein AQUCO_01700669v1 [Aquilegia coerulea]PIA45287.1 hypothetical protein AQUCO_01700669v1 [Aquilegia coerulea]